MVNSSNSSNKGAVVCHHPKAAALGTEILKQGGSAADAAVTVALALSVLEPWMSGMGGGGFIMLQPPASAPARFLDANMRSPLATNLADYPLAKSGVSSGLFPWPMVEGEANTLGAKSICAPTFIPALEMLWQEHGKMPWSELFQPAISLAKDGMKVDWYAQLMISASVVDLSSNEATAKKYLTASTNPLQPQQQLLAPKGTAWTALDANVVDMSDLAATMDIIAREGSIAITQGDVAKALIKDVKDLGGLITDEDFTLAQPEWREPAHLSWQGNQIFTSAAQSGGPSCLDIFTGMDSLTQAGTATQLDKDYYAALVTSIMAATKKRLQEHGDNQATDCTTNFCVLDKDGMLLASTLTLVSMFGSKVLSPSTGIMLNNALSWFDPEPGKANSLAAGKRCLSNMSPMLIKHKSGGLSAIGGAGGRKIMPAVAQLLSFILHADKPLEDAFIQPRVDVKADGTVIADVALGDEILQHLAGLDGVKVHTVEADVFPYHFGIVGGINLSGDTVTAACDPQMPRATALTS